jgi:hypothetical protein
MDPLALHIRWAEQLLAFYTNMWSGTMSRKRATHDGLAGNVDIVVIIDTVTIITA